MPFRRLWVSLPPLLGELRIGFGRALTVSALLGSARRAQQRTRAVLVPA
jgi:hypothetical protein